MTTSWLAIRNAHAFPLSEVPVCPITDFRDLVIRQVAAGQRLVALFHIPEDGHAKLCAVLADDGNRSLGATIGVAEGDRYPSLTPDCLQAHLFEREIAENGGPLPEGHPWLKPVRFPRNSALPHRSVGGMDFYRVDGQEVHEVAVGPVHAGVIEPGHFRFQCHGEIVLHLEISLGYQHRGVETAFPGATPVMRRLMAESVSGDSTAGHATAYCGSMEALSRTRVPGRARMIRNIAQELERAACHIGDLGALAGDVGFLPTSSFCGRIRGVVLNMTAALCGNRFSRGLLRPGGVTRDIDKPIVVHLLGQLRTVRRDAIDAVNLLWETPTVMARFEGTGVLTREDAVAVGLVGPASRACGVARDVRSTFPYAGYDDAPIPIQTEETGDVLARARVRSREVVQSLDYVGKHLLDLPDTPLFAEPEASTEPDAMVVSMTEGWRGEIVHIAMTDDSGALSRYKIVDPSFHNWFGLAMAMRNRGISDFPLCNKSFNLSYCGFDL